MSITIMNSADLGNPYQCPRCRRLFYFDMDYIKHKCVARKVKMKNV